jgi:hypothetical protein
MSKLVDLGERSLVLAAPVPTRRQFVVGVGAGMTSLAFTRESEGAAWFWAVARFVGAAVASWAISKALDTAWDSARTSSFAIEPVRSNIYRPDRAPETLVVIEPKAVSGEASEYAKKRIAAHDPEPTQFSDGRHVIPNAFFTSFRQHDVTLADAFAHWGAPTTEAMKRELRNGGEVIGQWWINHKTGRAVYVVTRSYGVGKAHFLPFRNEAAGVAERVVHGDEPSRPRMRSLIYDPDNYEFQEDDPPGRG